ncbi:MULTISPECIES: phosphatidate cytidylyltransferase [Desulfitobacterium]|uniref:Phosphatidate cytidylyltransferase n=1 Tax=Desulfitobacterium dehalogenans (strain ATCC 51507 / DSM 9161 / JW/IU-DC1) TaxID=756499 RepID=I4ABR1_DESDJ|nr:MULTISPECIES: phosphatidate cytidylyltransferase [Desulfitobacterium]AFM01396.1 CDP-diglyceride synthetase [Desulfitobacterium dehalogenans ATCC 51507]
MLTRTLSALVFVPIILGLTYLGGVYTALLVTTVSLIALKEALAIGEKLGFKAWTISSGIFSMVWLYLMFAGETQWKFPLMIAWLLFAMGRMALGYPRVNLGEAGYNCFAPIYTVVLFSHLYLIRGFSEGIAWAILTFILVWATDTFAYLIGRVMGKRLLAPHVSPKKTIEGSLGGLVFCILSGILAWKIIGGAPFIAYIVLSIVVAVSAQIGDLFESALKRSANIKDSGKVIPGHGGILDRFDSLLFVIPIMYYWALFVR